MIGQGHAVDSIRPLKRAYLNLLLLARLLPLVDFLHDGFDLLVNVALQHKRLAVVVLLHVYHETCQFLPAWRLQIIVASCLVLQTQLILLVIVLSRLIVRSHLCFDIICIRFLLWLFLLMLLDGA